MIAILIFLLFISLACNIIVFASQWNRREKVKGNSNNQKFIRKQFEIPYSEKCSSLSWNVKNISSEPDIIRKVYEHLSSTKKVYYWFFEVQDWDYFDSYIFYSDKLSSWCEFVHRNGMYAEFRVHRTGNRYDINYQENLRLVPEFWNYLMPMYAQHKEEYLNDNNL